MELRPYQQTIVDQIRVALRSGVRSHLVVSPTGSGKTAIFCHIAAADVLGLIAQAIGR